MSGIAQAWECYLYSQRRFGKTDQYSVIVGFSAAGIGAMVVNIKYNFVYAIEAHTSPLEGQSSFPYTVSLSTRER